MGSGRWLCWSRLDAGSGRAICLNTVVVAVSMYPPVVSRLTRIIVHARTPARHTKVWIGLTLVRRDN